MKKMENQKKGSGFLIFLSWLFFLLSGLAVGYISTPFINEYIDISPSLLFAQKNQEITEKPVYLNSASEARYIDQASDPEIFARFLADSQNHFTFISDLNANSAQLPEYRDFIMVNSENQYSRLSAKFNSEIDHKITIKLLDDWDQFREEMDLTINDNPKFMAFTKKGETIEVFVDKDLPALDKFELAGTISHEMVHAFQYNKYLYIFSVDANLTWLYEGMAENWKYPKETALLKPDLGDKFASTSALNSTLQSASNEDLDAGYAVASGFFDFMEKKYGEATLIEIFNNSFICQICWPPKDFYQEYTKKTGSTVEADFREWVMGIENS